MISNMLWASLLATAASTSFAADENCMMAATCSGDDKSSMLQTRINVAPQLEQLEQVARAPKPAVTSPACGFETSDVPYCGTWRQSQKDWFDWTRKSGPSPSSRTGPSKAHSGNHYMYIEASNKRKGAFSILKSTTTTFGAGAWLSFQYHMFGVRIGTLEVVFAEGPRKQTSLWKKMSAQGNKWHLADIDLSSLAGKTGEIWLAATLVKTCAQYLGDTAIDEVSLTTGTGSAPAAPIGTENNPPKKVPTQSPATTAPAAPAAPSPSPCDETLTGRGHSYRGCQDKTRSGRTCQKWTSQKPQGHGISANKNKGRGIGDHNFCRNPDGEPTLWCYTTDSKKRWEFCDPKVAKTGVSKPKVTSTPCGFETSAKPYCATWSNARDDQFDWTRRSGSTPTSRTGPSRAHSGNHYMYIEASFRKGGDTAILQSVSTTFRAGAWLRFQYHMFGPRIGTLKVVFKEPSAGPVIVWQKNGDRGNKWDLADIDLSPYAGKTGVIQLHGIITHKCASFLGDIAIDEISLTPGSGTVPAPPSAPVPAPSAQSDLFGRVDENDSKNINRDEFKKAVQAGKIIVPSAKNGDVSPTTVAPPDRFDRVDTDHSKSISRDELKKALDDAKVVVAVKAPAVSPTQAPGLAPAPATPPLPTQAQKDAIVAKHNALRASVGASDMALMSWDNTLADAAHKWVSGCPSGHSKTRNNAGENIAWKWATNLKPTATTDFGSSIQAWFDEVRDAGPYKSGGTFQGFSKCSGVCGHYTQVVWAAANKIGCGVAYCPHKTGMGGYELVCQYGTSVSNGYGGNMGGSTVFTKGSACSNCPNGFKTCKGNLCSPEA